jgi:GH15 family glucan-1,4-alpha-glucosidase
MSTLYDQSVTLILEHQAPSGAYIASPNFSTYAYSWLRDGSFIAHAMDRAEHHASATRFHRWVAAVLERYANKMDTLMTRAAAGEVIRLEDQMHTRFTLDGVEADEEWTNFQLDGYGTWLWALIDHVQRTGNGAFYAEMRPQVLRLVRYIETFWQRPCYDCWEEWGDKIHMSTLAAVYGGVQALAIYDPAAVPATLAAAIKTFVLEHGVHEGYLVKFVGSALVDASVLGVATPYRLLAADDPRMVATVTRIEADLRRGGVCRYRDDTYYGGGAWVLLAAWLGCYYTETGNVHQAQELRDWVAAQADAQGHLPEQVSTDLLAPAYYDDWVARWGPIAQPLLWSHAMYLILEAALRQLTLQPLDEGVAPQ